MGAFINKIATLLPNDIENFKMVAIYHLSIIVECEEKQ